jgi:radical SAM protein (TIGR01212 family)
MQLYQSYRNYLKKKFGGPVLKVPLNGGFSCPNRQAGEGCSFCDNRAFSPVAIQPHQALQQLRQVLARASRPAPVIAYLQPFSNTFGSVEQLREVYEPLIAEPGVVGLALGTRPDCFAEGVLDYLADVNTRTYLSVELGLQSGHDSTLARVSRGHSVAQFCERVEQLKRRGIYTVAHVILGLPGESDTMMVDTARLLARLGVGGVKFHQLMVVQGTALEQEYRRGELQPLSLEHYAAVLGSCLANLAPGQHIHRLMADSSEQHGLLAPLWSADKVGSLAFLQKYLRTAAISQGCCWEDT